MDIQLVQLYVLVCTVYDTRGTTCFQRTSHNPDTGRITDQEIITIYWFGHLQGHLEKKAIHQLDVPAKSKNAGLPLARRSRRQAHFALSRRSMRGSG